ncbi:hypothetical protein [Chitinophaga sancti]|uniref:hypothetical protein n=1 Tax=Chitinophaga sancti TaxID=1004 RepID=UPI003F7AE731
MKVGSRFDVRQSNGKPGALHFNKVTKELKPTPHVNGDNIPGEHAADPPEFPWNNRYITPGTILIN